MSIVSGLYTLMRTSGIIPAMHAVVLDVSEKLWIQLTTNNQITTSQVAVNYPGIIKCHGKAVLIPKWHNIKYMSSARLN